jgi:hypothetical protein
MSNDDPKAWLSALPLEPTVLNDLIRLAESEVEPISFYSLAEMREESQQAIWLTPSEHGLLIFGGAGNGDAWALDLQASGAVVLLSHDRIWAQSTALEDGDFDDDELPPSPRDEMHVVAPSLTAALELAAQGDLPEDYWLATHPS